MTEIQNFSHFRNIIIKIKLENVIYCQVDYIAIWQNYFLTDFNCISLNIVYILCLEKQPTTTFRFIYYSFFE